MIDYEKLREAHKLYPQGYLKIIPIFNNDGELDYMNYSMDTDNAMPDYFYTLDDLIKKLKERTHPEPKYKVGQLLWYIDDENSIESFVTIKVEKDYENHPEYLYWDGTFWWNESQLFPTRQALIEHQIDYWRNQLEDELEQHVLTYCKPKFEGKIIGFGYDGHKITPDVQSNQIMRTNKGDEIQFIKGGIEPDIQSNQSQVDVDRCQHEFEYITVSGRTRCRQCGKFLYEECQHDYQMNDHGYMYCLKCNKRPPSNECQHESDGTHYDCGWPGANDGDTKCIKCGEFYR